MDTSEELTTPVGDDGATSSQETVAEVTTQPEQTESPSAGENVESGAEATLLAGKYKSAQELEKAYKELEGKLGGLGQKAKLADVIQQKYGVTPEQFQAQIEAQELEAKRQLYASNPLAPVMDEVASLREMVQRQEAEKAYAAEQNKLNDFVSKNPEYEPFKDKLMELAFTNPKYANDDSIGYDQIANEWFGKAIATGQEGAYKKIETKKIQSSGTKSTPQKNFTLEDLKNLPTSELEKILPWRN